MEGSWCKFSGRLCHLDVASGMSHRLEILVPTTTALIPIPNQMDPVLSLVIHEILPTEILEMIFEEHAILEWEAPTNDGRVCRLWRQIVLNTPRAWAYLESRKNYAPSMDEVRLRLHRSNQAPLHIDFRAKEHASQRLYELFNDHHTRIASMRMRYGSQTFFAKRDFPCMQLLDVGCWYPVRWGSMPKLQSLLLGTQQFRQLGMWPLSKPSPLKILSLPANRPHGTPNHARN